MTYLDKYGVTRPCCRRLFMSPSSIILTKQNDKCVFEFTEGTLDEASLRPYKGGSSFLKLAKSKVDNLFVAEERVEEKKKKPRFSFVEGEEDKIYSTVPGIPRINKEVKKQVPTSTKNAIVMEYTDREYLVF